MVMVPAEASCDLCLKGLIERTHQLHVDLMRNEEVLRSRLAGRRTGWRTPQSNRQPQTRVETLGFHPRLKVQACLLLARSSSARWFPLISRRTLYALIGPEKGQVCAPVMGAPPAPTKANAAQLLCYGTATVDMIRRTP